MSHRFRRGKSSGRRSTHGRFPRFATRATVGARLRDHDQRCARRAFDLESANRSRQRAECRRTAADSSPMARRPPAALALRVLTPKAGFGRAVGQAQPQPSGSRPVTTLCRQRRRKKPALPRSPKPTDEPCGAIPPALAAVVALLKDDVEVRSYRTFGDWRRDGCYPNDVLQLMWRQLATAIERRIGNVPSPLQGPSPHGRSKENGCGSPIGTRHAGRTRRSKRNESPWRRLPTGSTASPAHPRPRVRNRGYAPRPPILRSGVYRCRASVRWHCHCAVPAG